MCIQYDRVMHAESPVDGGNVVVWEITAGQMQILSSEGRVVIADLRLAETYWEKFRGLMMDTSLKPDEALLIRNCRAIHCCFMLMAIDVLFVDNKGRICHIIEKMRPWTFSPFVKDGADVVECYPGTVERYKLKVGDSLQIAPVESASESVLS